MIPSVTPFFQPTALVAPVLASAFAAFSHSQIVHLLLSLSYLLLGISFASFSFAIYIFFLSLKRSITSSKVILELKPPHDTRQTAFSTEQLFTTLHSLGLQTTWWQCFLGRKKIYALELVATRNEGIRYCLRIYKEDGEVIKKTIRAYILQ